MGNDNVIPEGNTNIEVVNEEHKDIVSKVSSVREIETVPKNLC